ncbi:hypothetical protein C8P68_101500 [Mucilaginibacter yixingensis]|uniref:Oligosaccharide repeat unit polymerase n=1 Tax=Mucilaginibacter yixingensis TaxID=1295612 RepID=A0A2T5JFX8_9SPHI|nr:hypothetical protein [Mucilaginibacter yixingensis]PTR01266.1 hypothetical protein C8P68_101500 [Mucilaginibacter yixingensis]
MQKRQSLERIIFLYMPWGLALLCSSSPATSYLIAWLGSFFIFFITFTGILVPLPDDRPLAEQLMRPILLVHIIFAGYMCCTSIFYFLDALGYDNFHKMPFVILDQHKIELIAQCQRYYCLAHAAFVTGIVSTMRYPIKQKVRVEVENITQLLFKAALITYPASILFLKLPGLSQFANQFNSLSFIACTLALAFAIPEKKAINTTICSLLYAFNFYTSLVSGFKEPIIISVMVLGIFLYPTYKKAVIITFIPALLLLFVLLPTYAAVFRQNAWSGDVDSNDARELAIDAALNQDSETLNNTNWTFLVYRLSEIDMFTSYLESTPDKIPYYNLDLVKQSFIVLVPRVFWPSKPSTEALVMERVYNAGVINRGSNVSAKPAYIVDGYLSGGVLGIFISLFLYGAAAQFISQKAEQLFGGYLLGTALMFSGLFQIFWRGLSFEFILNNVFWSYVSMLLIARYLRKKDILQAIEDTTD